MKAKKVYFKLHKLFFLKTILKCIVQLTSKFMVFLSTASYSENNYVWHACKTCSDSAKGLKIKGQKTEQQKPGVQTVQLSEIVYLSFTTKLFVYIYGFYTHVEKWVSYTQLPK